MANTLKIKRGTAATIPNGALAEPLFTSDTYDLYIGKGDGTNQRFQKYIASGTSSQFLKGDGSLDSTTYQATSEKGQNNGYASLDSGGKVPAAQLPNSIMDYKGTWDASTNTPTLADGTGNAGDVYICSVGGTQNLGSGSITFAAGDWVVYSGSVWQKSINSNAVASVNGQTGAVVLYTDDISEDGSPTNLWFTNARARTAISATSPVQYNNSTGVISILDASGSQSGVVTTGTQTFAGNKTFSDLLYGNQHIYFGMSTGADYYVRTPNVSTSRRGLFLSNGVNTDLKVYAGGTQTLGAWTESDTTLVIGTGFQGGGGSAETILFHSSGIGNLMAITASNGGAIYAYRNIILPANNTVGGTNYGIQQQMASNDEWRIYGNSVAADQGELVFELADNAQSWSSNGQRFRFYFNPSSGGTAKNVLLMDYDTAVFTTSVTATSIIRSGGTSSQFLKADGSVDSNTYLTTSSAASTYVPYTGATTNVNIGTNSMTAFNFYASSTFYVDSNNYFMKSILELRDNATSTKRIYITADTSESLISTVNTVPLKLRATSGVTEQVVLNTNGTISFTGAATFSSNVGVGIASGTTYTGFTLFQVGSNASLTSTSSGIGSFYLGNNAFLNSSGSWQRISTGYASDYYQENGKHAWRTIGSGNAGTTFTFSQVMTLDENGRLGIGANSPNSVLEVKASGATNSIRLGSIAADATYNGIFLNGSIAEGVALGMAGGGGSDTSLYIQSGNAGSIIFRTGNGTNYSQRMTITSGGNVEIGTGSLSVANGNQTANSISSTIFLGNRGYFTGANVGAAQISAISTGTFWYSGTALAFYTNPGPDVTATANVERMRINSNGNVSIGNTANSFRLDVSLDSGVNGQIIRMNRSAGAYGWGIGIDSSSVFGIYDNGGNRPFLITSGGNVLIGTTSDNGGKLQVSGGDVRVSGGVRFSSSGADANRWSVYWNGGTGDLIVVNNISDIRAKKDFDYNIKGLETIQKLKPLKFTWKDGTSHSTSVSGRLRQYGFIAQETMEADDFLAWYNESQDSWGIEQYESFSAVIVKAIQEQQAQIEELKSKL